MKVAEIMNKQVESVQVTATIRDVARLIFGRGINGVPVCKGKKIVGFVTERDILAKFYPSMQEYVDDPVHSSNFEEMEENVADVLTMTVDKIMSKTPICVTEKTPILRAQSLMFLNKVGRLPVLNNEGNLIGILSKGDIFRAIVGQKLPFAEEEGFYDWLAHDYDRLMDWNSRLASEIPDLLELFKKEKVKTVVDIASSTGEHTIALAKRGYVTYGIETSSTMYEIAEQKREKLSSEIKRRVHFLKGKYGNMMRELPKQIDLALFLGNALAHVLYTDPHILEQTIKTLTKNGILVLQLTNVEKVVHQHGFRDFVIRDSTDRNDGKYAFLSYYTKEKKNTALITRAVFDFEEKQWVFRRINSTQVIYLGKKEVTEVLKKLGFSDISYYGGAFDGKLFSEPFDPQTSDQLNIIARR